jgi:hypothetical protein
VPPGRPGRGLAGRCNGAGLAADQPTLGEVDSFIRTVFEHRRDVGQVKLDVEQQTVKIVDSTSEVHASLILERRECSRTASGNRREHELVAGLELDQWD